MDFANFPGSCADSIHSGFSGNFVSVKKFLNYGKYCLHGTHLQDGTVCERAGVKNEVNKIAFEIQMGISWASVRRMYFLNCTKYLIFLFSGMFSF